MVHNITYTDQQGEEDTVFEVEMEETEDGYMEGIVECSDTGVQHSFRIPYENQEDEGYDLNAFVDECIAPLIARWAWER